MKHLTLLFSLFLMWIVVASPVRSFIAGRNTNTIITEQKPYDSKVEYIGSKNNSKSYIDSGIVLQESDGYLRHLVVSYTSDDPGSWGFFAYSFSRGQWVGAYPSKTDRVVCFGSYSKIYYSNTSAQGWADYKYDSQSGWYVNGEQRVADSCVLGTDSRTTIKGKSLWLLMIRDVRYENQPYSPMAVARYKRIQIELDGELVRDFIPVRITNEDGLREGALYDYVSGEVFRDVGTGAGFEIGPDL